MRARNIKPGFFKNEELADIEPLGRILFQGLWCMADREGRLEDRPKRIKVEILPYDNCNIERLLNLLHDKNFIIRYSINGLAFIQVVNFTKHQSPHMKESASTIPAPDLHQTCTVQTPDENGSSTEVAALNPDTGFPITDTLETTQSTKQVRGPRPLSPEKLGKLWNDHADLTFPRVILPFNNGRKQKFNAALKEHPDPEWWIALFQKASGLSFLKGDNDRGWRADLEFVVKRRVEILEGRYDRGINDRNNHQSKCPHDLYPADCKICRDHIKKGAVP